MPQNKYLAFYLCAAFEEGTLFYMKIIAYWRNGNDKDMEQSKRNH